MGEKKGEKKKRARGETLEEEHIFKKTKHPDTVEENGRERRVLQGRKRRQAGNVLFLLLLFVCVCVCVCGVVSLSSLPPSSSRPPSSLPHSLVGSGTALLQLNETDPGIYLFFSFSPKHAPTKRRRRRKKTEQPLKKARGCCTSSLSFFIFYRRDVSLLLPVSCGGLGGGGGAGGGGAGAGGDLPRPFAVIDGVCA